MREKVSKEYLRRLRLVLESELNSKNKIQAVNSLAIPVLQYSFGIIEWNEARLEKLDTKTRKLLTTYGMHHPKADVDRLYMPRNEGGRGLIEIVTAFKLANVQLANYLNLEKDKLTKMVKEHEAQKGLYSIIKISNEVTTAYRTNNKDNLKKEITRDRINRYKNKPLHGQYLNNIDNKQFINKENTFNWLKAAGLKGETESLIVAAQDQALNTRYHQKNILKQQVDSKCRLCHQQEEHISHIVSGCPILAPKEYLNRHNKVASYVHYEILKSFNIPVEDKWYEHQPQTTTTTPEATIMWDMGVITDRTINANRPDIVVHDKKNNVGLLIDIAVPEDMNVAVKEAEKLNKYKDLEIEISRMWKVKTQVIPVVIGALGATTKRHLEHLNRIPGQVKAAEAQKIALLGTARIIRKVLDIK